MKKLFVVLAVLALSACANPWRGFNDSEEANVDVVTFVTPYHVAQEQVDTPHLYSVIAARTANTMLGQTKKTYETSPKPKLYIMQVKKMGADSVPDGFQYAHQVTKEIIEGTKSFTVVNTPDRADYQLDISVMRYDISGTPGRMLQYKLTLLNKKKETVGTWIEHIRQLQNDDKSWW